MLQYGVLSVQHLTVKKGTCKIFKYKHHRPHFPSAFHIDIQNKKYSKIFISIYIDMYIYKTKYTNIVGILLTATLYSEGQWKYSLSSNHLAIYIYS